MGQKDKKRKKKIERQEWNTFHAWADQQASALIDQYAEPSMYIEFAYEGRMYKGSVPCVGEVEK